MYEASKDVENAKLRLKPAVLHLFVVNNGNAILNTLKTIPPLIAAQV